MYYSGHPGHCRVDFFKPSGKWYTTERLDWADYYNEPLIHEAFRKILFKQINQRYLGMQAVCLEPYHINSHPVSLIWDGEEER
jgi:hypothetical protein